LFFFVYAATNQAGANCCLLRVGPALLRVTEPTVGAGGHEARASRGLHSRCAGSGNHPDSRVARQGDTKEKATRAQERAERDVPGPLAAAPG